MPEVPQGAGPDDLTPPPRRLRGKTTPASQGEAPAQGDQGAALVTPRGGSAVGGSQGAALTTPPPADPRELLGSLYRSPPPTLPDDATVEERAIALSERFQETHRLRQEIQLSYLRDRAVAVFGPQPLPSGTASDPVIEADGLPRVSDIMASPEMSPTSYAGFTALFETPEPLLNRCPVPRLLHLNLSRLTAML